MDQKSKSKVCEFEIKVNNIYHGYNTVFNRISRVL